jgi:hypothetical protein
VKPKAKALVLPHDTIRGYLDGVPTLSISPRPTTPAVSRDFMRLAYGGSSATLIQKIQTSRDPSHTPTAGPSQPQRAARNVVYPQLNMNPAVPRHPGEPGLLFATRPEFIPDASHNEETKGPFTLFGCEKQAGGGKIRWRYLGEYETECVGKVTGEEFSQQKDAVKNAWGAQVVKKKTGPYVRMRRRIALRKAGRDPDDDETNEMVKKQKEKEEIGNIDDSDEDGEDEVEDVLAGSGDDSLLPVTAEDVIQAFSQGQEVR